MTDQVVIRVENLGKKYRIRHNQPERYVALRDVIAQKFAVPFKFLRGLGRSKITDGALRAKDGSSKMEDSSLASLSTNSNLPSSGEARPPGCMPRSALEAGAGSRAGSRARRISR